MINSQFNRIRSAAAAAAMAAAVTFAAPMAALPALAATGTVTGSDINVRSEAGSDSSQVGTVTTGDVVTVGETATDASGATWYQVTLDNGTVGYIRGDFLTVDESSDTETTDEAADGESTDDAETTEDAATEGESTDAAAADAAAAAEQDTGGYQIVLAPDENGTDTYYLYDNNEGKRMKISDIQQLENDVTTAQTTASSAKKTMMIVAFALGAVCTVLLVAVIVLVIKLKDALANGRRERDLTMERRDQRRVDQRADSVESLRRPRGQQSARSRGRDDAYASNARRVTRDSRAEDRTERRAARPASDGGNYTTRTRAAAPARDTEARTAARQGARPAASTERTARPAASAERTARPAGSAERTARPAAEARSTETAARRPAQQQTARQTAKNFADDDFDYDFLKLDDGE